MQATLRVNRYDPEVRRPEPHVQEYQIDIPETSTVLDALIKIREELDPSLALRCSCRAAICGSCAMRVNEKPGLACKTQISTIAPKGEPIAVGPIGNLPVIKDLVVDQQPFWQKIRAVAPYLQPDGPEPEEEYIAPNEAMQELIGVMGCIMCGACVSDCTVMAIDNQFLGPAALAKAYRFVGDPRDGADQDRLSSLNEYGGVWDCTRCYECVQACPKGVAPMERIMTLREQVMNANLAKGYGGYGSRHVTSFAKSVEHSGWLDELKLPVETWGMFNVPKLLSAMPVGLRALIRGKLPPILHKKRPGTKHLKRIFRATRESK